MHAVAYSLLCLLLVNCYFALTIRLFYFKLDSYKFYSTLVYLSVILLLIIFDISSIHLESHAPEYELADFVCILMQNAIEACKEDGLGHGLGLYHLSSAIVRYQGCVGVDCTVFQHKNWIIFTMDV